MSSALSRPRAAARGDEVPGGGHVVQTVRGRGRRRPRCCVALRRPFTSRALTLERSPVHPGGLISEVLECFAPVTRLPSESASMHALSAVPVPGSASGGDGHCERWSVRK